MNRMMMAVLVLVFLAFSAVSRAEPVAGDALPAESSGEAAEKTVGEELAALAREIEKTGAGLETLSGKVDALRVDRVRNEITALRREIEALREGLRLLERYVRETQERQFAEINGRLAAERNERRQDTAEILRLLRAVQLDVRTFGSGARIPFQVR